MPEADLRKKAIGAWQYNQVLVKWQKNKESNDWEYYYRFRRTPRGGRLLLENAQPIKFPFERRNHRDAERKREEEKGGNVCEINK